MIADHFHVTLPALKRETSDRLFQIYRQYVLREQKSLKTADAYQAQTALEIHRLYKLMHALHYRIKFDPRSVKLEEFYLNWTEPEEVKEEKPLTYEEQVEQMKKKQAMWAGMLGCKLPGDEASQ